MDCASDSHHRFRQPFGPLTEAELKKLSEYVRLASEHWSTERGERAFEGAYHILYPYAYGVVKRKILWHEDVEEIVNTALWKAWRTLQRYDQKKAFLPWFYRIVLNVTRDHLRRDAHTRMSKERRPIIVSFDAATHNHEDGAESLDLRLDLEKWVATLPEGLRRLLELRYHDERTIKEVAVILGKSTRWVDERLRMIREVLAPLCR